MSSDEHAIPQARSWRTRVPAPLRHGVAIFVALLVIEYLVIPKFVAASHAVSLLTHVNIIFLVIAVVIEAGSLFSYALLTRVLLPPDAPGVGTLLRVDLATLAIAHVVPGGSAASATLGYRLFTKLGVDGRATGFAMATQGLGSAVVLNVLLWISLVVSVPFAGVHAIYATVAVVGLIAILAVAALVFAFTRGEETAIRIVGTIGRRVPRLTEERVTQTVREIGDSLRNLWSDRDQLRRMILWAALNWILDATCLWAFLAAFHHYVNPVELFAAYGIGNVLGVIPITPGGLGVVEATTILLLKSFGVPGDVALEAVIGWRLINFWLPIPVGAGCYISLRPQIGAGRGKPFRAMAAEARGTDGQQAGTKDARQGAGSGSENNSSSENNSGSATGSDGSGPCASAPHAGTTDAPMPLSTPTPTSHHPDSAE